MTLVEFAGSNFIECENEVVGVRSADATSTLLTLTVSPFPFAVELKEKVSVRLNPMNLVTSTHSSLRPHATGGVPAVIDGGPPLIVVWLNFVVGETTGTLLVPL